ncbi:decorin-binding protein DbpA (plasmid) [Borreliella spielmanii]|uniref:Decorin binding protein A n=1 Tax=Borreliella spielmanii A14S TaxID=498742 RepID=C0RC32_9SPIR|nr:decorin-binding protein DbpA [Borreliella spielmanii]ACN53322.1 decorin binding protein A [Borreliella spielmanii A14S]WKC83064.1 decorin-binding protein DbpA [Borreliella spielmanii]
MNKYTKNLLKLSLLASLLVACSLTGKAKLESSVKDITNEIDKAIKEAQEGGVDTNAFTDQKTGAKMGGPKTREAKLRIIALTLQFLKETKEEAIKLKEYGAGEDEFKELYELMLKISKAVEGIGIQNMTATVSMGIVENPPTTAERVIEIANTIESKLKKIETKQ